VFELGNLDGTTGVGEPILVVVPSYDKNIINRYTEVNNC
jgi:hypothetical protein